MPLTNKQKQAALRARRAKAGLKRIEYWLTDKEKTAIDKKLKQMQKGN